MAGALPCAASRRSCELRAGASRRRDSDVVTLGIPDAGDDVHEPAVTPHVYIGAATPKPTRERETAIRLCCQEMDVEEIGAERRPAGGRFCTGSVTAAFQTRYGGAAFAPADRWLAQPKLSAVSDCPPSRAAFMMRSGGQPSPAIESEGWRPQRDSNPCFGLERATSWASGRWGRTEAGYEPPILARRHAPPPLGTPREPMVPCLAPRGQETHESMHKLARAILAGVG